MSNQLTLHFLCSIPYSNLNRDDTGVPKRVMQGGALRALHSSQSIKRGSRVLYENASQDLSIRSGRLDEEVAEKAMEMNPDLDEKTALKQAAKLIGNLTKGEAKSGEGDAKRSTWLSSEEILTAATYVANSTDPREKFIDGNTTGSLAIAAFGRMFANATDLNTEAAVAVSPAITTHQATIETDYFSTADDINLRDHKANATYLDVSLYTSGTFYRTVTIDRNQLRTSWSGFESNSVRENLEAFVRSLVYGQPRGKKNSTAPFTMPSLILAEEQQYRVAYDFERPVEADKDGGGFMKSSIEKLAKQYTLARSFDPGNFGPVEALSGTYPDLDGHFGDLKKASLDSLIGDVVDWILDA
ncbi:type I-E CRISPR-associated protein Cas7/Cse4/CasC [Corynebacterium glucuronolyticum]|uniref:Type I-E CRISPR-associated protein Cas7/Cse4/CasC n=2 Tax=Corynebacterium glucuronolyticum TaxID=39791 RepID=A0AAX1L8P2_9CORY|nr:type I-E CRISPR-associated protein Cas7/Cse4/CasC [Corynebacterium glucuronolyticum]EEI64035.1 CRISPR system CASCADE complex protein CasC [Corynebacterium glucuronolyticum ATCC 51866]QRP70813.1 type I-E CRISPR-associated protein Cas7/Cse4/CasC [Corynebacterium glucuronolyticum]